jgi:hypothetical protein
MSRISSIIKIRKPRKKPRTGFYLFVKDSPFKPRIIHNKKLYNRKKRLDISKLI